MKMENGLHIEFVLEVMGMNHWDQFLAPYKQAVDELKIKLKGMRTQFEQEHIHSPIEFCNRSCKTNCEYLDKAMQKGIPLDQLESEMQDIAGLRMMCQFVDDIKR